MGLGENSLCYPIKYDEIGIVPQDLAYLENLTVEENIDFFCGLWVSDSKQRKQYARRGHRIL